MCKRGGVVYQENESKSYIGKIEGYDTNDILEYRKNYINGKKEVISKWYYENGELKFEKIIKMIS